MTAPPSSLPSRVIGAAAVLALAGCASPPSMVPPSLQPAAGERPAMTLAARGVQIYECRAGAAGAAAAWTFVAPDAALFDAQGRPVGQHGAGPFWQAADGSRIVGTVKARADAPDAGAIPWLLLSTQATGPQGSLSRVTSVQRVNTVGGVAPATACTTGNAGSTTRVAYTADYHFFSPR